MPYRTNRDLPASVQAHLPVAAQTIYRKAYNNAWKEYADPGTRRGRASREATAHRVAWSAVKKAWRRQGERWIKMTKPRASRSSALPSRDRRR